MWLYLLDLFLMTKGNTILKYFRWIFVYNVYNSKIIDKTCKMNLFFFVKYNNGYYYSKKFHYKCKNERILLQK